ncbi:MAG: hypothetical protein CMJ34_15230 [Phycisphaerae bacterium]|nr:hypothetical protein [Phycisphaerae bacterium]
MITLDLNLTTRKSSVPCGLLGLGIVLMLAGCGGPTVTDPSRILADPGEVPARHRAAVGIAQGQLGDKETERLLRRMIVSPGYTVESREVAWDALVRMNRESLGRQLEVDLPRLDSPMWRARVCELIVEETWIEMTPTLIRAWARPSPGFDGEPEDRPERKALIAMYGEEQLPRVLVQVMLDADPIVAANLRARCWELLIAEGRRDMVVELLGTAQVDEKDGLFRDLRTITSRTGVVPSNREEILWARALCKPENREYLDEIVAIVESLPTDRRKGILEMRDLGILVGASRLDPGLLELDAPELASRLATMVDAPGRRLYTADFTGYRGSHTERLREVLDRLDWGDLLAIMVAVEALKIQPMLSHLFDHAERDLMDKGTEFGGIIGIDDRGRFEVLEFPPRIRKGDIRFEAPQEMFDAGYSGLFHFHHHAQKYENRDYAGPHLGDFQYADGTRANCLVFTFIDSRTLNADWYRHGGVVVDLGVFRRPD